ncbi:hypothetical protein A0H81_08517 [Grifola frondosa]|uniref:F-box domain-containing protein n=1 Tax=Grifola frondosa TaxID=5627 RepID=A0A1C7M4X3_GRIFR|nr:hypothetical protein A0H81_08517 [Grifola frondosa]
MITRSSQRASNTAVAVETAPKVVRTRKGRATAAVATPQVTQVVQRVIRCRRGGLKDIANMPLDIVFEIFMYLDPSDLLHLARTSKDLRTILMNRSSEYVWKASRQQARNLPERPPFLSEPAFANLLFSPHCHKCLQGNIRKVEWDFFVRYCKKCSEKTITHKCGVEAMQLCPDLHPRHVLTSLRDQGMFYHVTEVKDLLRSWRKFSDYEKAAFVKKQKLHVEELRRYASLLRTWDTDKSRQRADELADIKNERLKMIKEYLRKEGWGPELDFWGRDTDRKLLSHEVVRKAVKLTERNWPKVRDTLTPLVEETRERRLKEERETALKSRLYILRNMIIDYKKETPRTVETEFLPRFAEFAFMPEFKALIDVPSSTKVTLDIFLPLRASMPKFIARWQADSKAKLAAIVDKRIGISKDPLNLAIAVFTCSSCKRLLRYPEVVAHRCLRQQGFWLGAALP